MTDQTKTQEVLTAMWAFGSEMRERFERMRAQAIDEITAILGEPVHLDGDGAIVLDADQRARLLAAVPPVHDQPPRFFYETAWGVPIRRAEQRPDDERS